MKSLPAIMGVVLIVLGALCLIYGGFSYTTQKEVLTVGEVKVMAPTDNEVKLPPLLGGLFLALGIGLIVFDRFKK